MIQLCKVYLRSLMCPWIAFNVRLWGICHPWICNRSVHNCYLPALTADQLMNRFQNQPLFTNFFLLMFWKQTIKNKTIESAKIQIVLLVVQRKLEIVNQMGLFIRFPVMLAMTNISGKLLEMAIQEALSTSEIQNPKIQKLWKNRSSCVIWVKSTMEK